MSGYKLLLPAFLLFSAICLSQPASRFDIIITEIMADPSPQVALPNAEFIEIKNNSGRELNLAGWRLSTVSSTSGAFPSHTLPADSFLVLSSTSSASQFSAFGRVLGIPGFPSLPNDGGLVSLVSREGVTIHAINYAGSWYDNAVKKEGGWSLEMIDMQNPCAGSSNWKASTDQGGGTPGRKNSVDGINPDAKPPQLLRTYSLDSMTLVAVFDEPLDSSSSATVSNYSLTRNISLLTASPQPPLFNVVILKLLSPLQKKTVYELTVSNVKDCRANAIGAFNKAKTGWAEEALATDIIINEILFNPRPNAYDYVEIYNKSDKILDAAKLYIANRNASGAISSLRKLSETSFSVFPGDYIVVTEDAASLQKEYFVLQPGFVLTLSSLPSYPDDEGIVVITNSRGEVIDEVEYSSKWHFALISDAEGVALERIDLNGPSQDKGNWHSAASTAGYGTPSAKNSQNRQNDPVSAQIEITPKTFSPDNDGQDDIATISYRLEEPGYVANITIFNSGGRAVRYLVKNATLSTKGSWNWDGLDEKAQKLPIGTYIIYTEIFNLQGKKQQFKNTAVVARRF